MPSILSASHLSDSGILLTFAERVLIAGPCSVTTTASEDGFSITTNTSHFPPLLACLAYSEYSLPIPGWVCVPSVVQPLQRCLSVAADVTPVASDMQRIPPASTVSSHRTGLWPPCDVPAQPSVSWPVRQRAHRTSMGRWTGSLPLAVSLERFGFLLDGLVRCPSPTPQSPAHCRI